MGVGSEAAALMPEAIKAERQTDREIGFTTQKGNGLAVAAQAALNQLIEDGDYAKILDRWGLSSEAIQKSELNPAGLPKK